MPQIVKYDLIWGPKVVPQDVKESFIGPIKRNFWSPWGWFEDGPVLEVTTPLGVTWKNLKSDLYGLLECGAVGEVLVVDLDSSNLVVNLELEVLNTELELENKLLENEELELGDTIISAYALTVTGAAAEANIAIDFPT